MTFSFSPGPSLIRDIGTVLFDGKGRQITIGSYMPVHTAGSHVCLEGILNYLGRDNIHPDDFIVANDTYIVRFGHLPDWSFLRPIFYEGELVFYHYLRSHQWDGGGAFPGGYFPRTFDCHAEGVIIPPTKIIESGKIDEKAFRLILANVRGSRMVRADNLLIFESMRKCEERVLDILGTYGKDTVLAACDELISRTEKSVKKIISTWLAGTYKAERAADWDGSIDRPVWVRLSLTVKPKEGQIILDFSESDAQVDFVNTPLGQTWSAAVTAVLWSLPPGIPRNEGLHNCMKVITKEGTVLGPVYPATTGAQAAILGQHITEVTQLALSQVVPKDTSALWGRHVNPLFCGKRRDRIDPRTGFVYVYAAVPFHSTPSNGAIYGFDGTDGIGPSLSGGAVLRGPIEALEWDAPHRWLRFELLQDSMGHGRWRGGMGTVVEVLNTYDPKVWQPLDCSVQTGNSDGEKFGALGLMGGMEGTKTKLGIVRGDKNLPLRCLDIQYIQPGDMVWTKSGGGGGVGDPIDREVEKVQWDALNEYISIETARKVYGVVIDPETFEVDYKVTTKLRKKLRARKKK